ncbi:MAG: hypothetical protein JST00_29925 [Deltaproteobacteria bacterium]|nr:hypothetical protein [Deltaproteobacteria bacterium]
MMMSSTEHTATLPIRSFDWSALEASLEQMLEHRALVRLVGPKEPTALDRIADDLSRLQKMLQVLTLRANETAWPALRMLVVRTFRWAIDVTTTLTDLDVETLDRDVTQEEGEIFARQVTAQYLALVDPVFDDVLPHLARGPRADASLHWDVETLRVAVERVILDVYSVD